MHSKPEEQERQVFHFGSYPVGCLYEVFCLGLQLQEVLVHLSDEVLLLFVLHFVCGKASQQVDENVCHLPEVSGLVAWMDREGGECQFGNERAMVLQCIVEGVSCGRGGDGIVSVAVEVAFVRRCLSAEGDASGVLHQTGHGVDVLEFASFGET